MSTTLKVINTEEFITELNKKFIPKAHALLQDEILPALRSPHPLIDEKDLGIITKSSWKRAEANRKEAIPILEQNNKEEYGENSLWRGALPSKILSMYQNIVQFSYKEHLDEDELHYETKLTVVSYSELDKTPTDELSEILLEATLENSESEGSNSFSSSAEKDEYQKRQERIDYLVEILSDLRSTRETIDYWSRIRIAAPEVA